jgi:hypothetical protein
LRTAGTGLLNVFALLSNWELLVGDFYIFSMIFLDYPRPLMSSAMASSNPWTRSQASWWVGYVAQERRRFHRWSCLDSWYKVPVHAGDYCILPDFVCWENGYP